MKTLNVNMKILQNYTLGKKTLMLSTIHLLIDEMERAKEGLSISLKNKDWGALKKFAHRLKPNLMFIGATEKNDIIIEIERKVDEQDNLNELPFIIEKIIKDLPLIVDELEQERSKLLLSESNK